jgi:hypothetical protein
MIKDDDHKADDDKDPKHVRVTLVWGGTGESKTAEVKVQETAGDVFDLIYQRFHQQRSDQDTFEVNGNDLSRARFGETLTLLVQQYGAELEFEAIPPTSGA